MPDDESQSKDEASSSLNLSSKQKLVKKPSNPKKSSLPNFETSSSPSISPPKKLTKMSLTSSSKTQENIEEKPDTTSVEAQAFSQPARPAFKKRKRNLFDIEGEKLTWTVDSPAQRKITKKVGRIPQSKLVGDAGVVAMKHYAKVFKQTRKKWRSWEVENLRKGIDRFEGSNKYINIIIMLKDIKSIMLFF